MNKMKKRFLVAVLVMTLVLSGTVTAFGGESGGVKLQYNGTIVSLAGADIEIIDGKAMLPAAETMKAIGEEATSDSQYISARELGTQLGYCVGWDAAEKTVVMFDPATLFAKTDEDFSIVRMLVKSDLDMEKAYATTGKFNLDITAYETANAMLPITGYSISGKMDGIQQKSSSELNMSLVFDFEKMFSGMPEDQQAMMAPFLVMFQNMEIKMKTNGETGETYVNSPLLSTITGTEGNNTWIKMNAYDSYENMGIDMKSIVAGNYSQAQLSDMLETAILNLDEIDAGTYGEIQDTYAMLKSYFGNVAFDTRTTGDITTHVLTLTDGTLEDFMEDMAFNTNIIIKEKNGKLYHYDMSGNFESEDGTGAFDLSGDSKNVIYDLTIDQKDVMKMSIETESHISETTESPDLSLPEDANVIEFPMY